MLAMLYQPPNISSGSVSQIEVPSYENSPKPSGKRLPTQPLPSEAQSCEGPADLQICLQGEQVSIPMLDIAAITFLPKKNHPARGLGDYRLRGVGNRGN